MEVKLGIGDAELDPADAVFRAPGAQVRLRSIRELGARAEDISRAFGELTETGNDLGRNRLGVTDQRISDGKGDNGLGLVGLGPTEKRTNFRGLRGFVAGRIRGKIFRDLLPKPVERTILRVGRGVHERS